MLARHFFSTSTHQRRRLRAAERYQRGDTLIEVLFSVAVFSLVAVMSLAIMNQGTATSVRALQITTVRQAMDGQAEILRFLNSSYVAAYGPSYTPVAGTPAAEYRQIIDAVAGNGSSVTAFGSGGANTKTCAEAPAGSFILNPVSAKYVAYSSAVMKPADTYAQLVLDSSNNLSTSQGLWIEAVRSANSSTTSSRYIDFHIRACWAAPGIGSPMNLGTIVRLYEPTY